MRELLAVTDPIHSCFGDYIPYHVVMNSDDTGALAINGVTARSAIDAFFRRPCSPRKLIEAPVPGAP
ncbi:hypothetical protein [Stigmatella aurantiaca]|uniref:Uncharacterized protein n=1 Tax=Stigmatella aurantiaca (strain DW4/3-1) TaxID=378806 RepID=E3FYV8_STIAD|nr:hypothetical protein [Stigmatella aurantiaca]ADO72421.1 uncharacterized protein STAUR_4641 [Stigmatella aurantiaca DW4/3-1]